MHVSPNIAQNFSNSQWLCEWATLAPHNVAVNKINWNLLQLLPVQEQSSIDTVIEQDQAVVFPSQQLSGMLLLNLTIQKNWAQIMLLRNLDPPHLCTGTRMVVKEMQSCVLDATIITGKYKGEDVFILWILLIPTDFPFLQVPSETKFSYVNKPIWRTIS